MRFKKFTAAAVFLLADAAHAQLTESDQRIVAAVKQRTPAALLIYRLTQSLAK